MTAVVVGGHYRHYKGDEYSILHVAEHADTGEEYVVYTRRYDNTEVWVRPKAIFVQSVIVRDVTVPRFTYLDKFPGK